ncbi:MULTISPECIES: acyl-CoA thioesterase domain-containing protein [unclassified Mycobacterium]|uniref:acyl-CoA thioesterase domain-containing protein n=1 Tax=unclassified Mycobacterium TaxID=2642494 RepID=UPI00336A3897
MAIDSASSLRASSLTVHFLRPADGGQLCDFAVERLYDGRAASTRGVTAVQEGESVAIGTLAFRAAMDTWAWRVPSE